MKTNIPFNYKDRLFIKLLFFMTIKHDFTLKQVKKFLRSVEFIIVILIALNRIILLQFSLKT